MFDFLLQHPNHCANTTGMFTNRQKLAEANQQIIALQSALDGMAQRFKEQPILTSITKSGRLIKFQFLRNDQLFTIEAMGTWDDDLDLWFGQLLDKPGRSATNAK